MEQIKTQTEQKLKELDAKYVVVDKVGKSFGFLAYATIGIFILFITFGDIMKIFKLISLKFRKPTSNEQKEMTAKLKMKENEKKLTNADLQKLKSLDERIDKLVQFYKASKKRTAINSV